MRDSRQLGEPSIGVSQRNEDSGRPGESPLAAGRCRPRGNPKPHRRRSWRSGEPGQPGPSPPAPLKDARFGATRKSIAGTAERTYTAGQPVNTSPDLPRDAFEGKLRKGQTEDARSAQPEDVGPRGNPDPHRKAGRDDHDPMSCKSTLVVEPGEACRGLRL